MICCGTRGIVDIPGGGEGGGGKAPGISTVSGRKRVGGTGGGGGGGRGGIDVEDSNHSSVKETKTSLLNLEHTNLNTTSGSEIATSWSPMHLKIECWRPEFQG